MKRKGPIVTLLGGAALAAALLIANINATGGDDDAALAGDDQTAPPTTPATTPDASPEADPAGDQQAADDRVEPVTYVGWVDEGTASVAIVIDDDQATAYVCDGAAVEAWLTGPARNGELLLSGEDGELTGAYDLDRATGQTTVQGRDWTFTIEQVAAPDGLYRFAETVAGGAEVSGGWIVLPDGTQVGVLTVDGDTQPAPALAPATGRVEVAGQAVVADRLG